jgi:putative transcriptional regulator
MKPELTGRVVELLHDAGFHVVDCTGSRSSFDILAKKGEVLFLIKILKNIEGFNKRASNELKKIASLLLGIPILIGETMKNSRLADDIVYDRYGIYVSNDVTFSKMINDILPRVYSTRGNYCVNIDSNLLSDLRHRAGLTQDTLAKRLNVSKQSIYRYENEGRVSMDVFERIVDLFEDEGLALPGFTMDFHFQDPDFFESVDRHITELKKIVYEEFKNIGFETSITNAPFDIYASKNERILSVVSNDWRRLKQRINVIRSIANLLGGYSLCVSERHIDVDVSVLKPDELHEINSPKEFFKILSE